MGPYSSPHVEGCVPGCHYFGMKGVRAVTVSCIELFLVHHSDKVVLQP